MTIKVASTSSTKISICSSALPYKWNGLTFNTAGTQTVHLNNVAGCDSAATLILTVSNPAITNNIKLNGCNSVTYNNIIYTSSTVVKDTLRGYMGCDSVYTIAGITVNNSQPVSKDTSIVGCNSVIFNGNTYISSTILKDTAHNYYGCDSVYFTVNINVNSLGIAGGIYHPSKGYVISGVSAYLKGTLMDTTIGNNNYSFGCLPNAANETVSLYKNNDVNKTNGVTALDIALVQSHILQKSLLNSPFKIIAADVNGDSKVTALDIVYMKRLILGFDTTFTNTVNGNKRLWAFVDSAYTFANPANPFPFQDSIAYTGLSVSQIKQSFVGIKLGDVNWDWNPAVAKPMISNINAIELSYDPIKTYTGNQVIIPVKVKNFKDMLGMQFTISFNASTLQWQGIGNNPLGFEMGTNHATDGSVTFLWVDPKNTIKTLDDGSVLMELVFTAINPLNNETLDLNSSITSVAAYDKDENLHNIILIPSLINILEIVNDNWMIAPNPSINAVINVQMNLKNNKTIVFRLSDITGRMLLVKKVEGVKGSNNFTLSETSQLPTGSYYLQAIGVEGEEVKKLIIR